MFPLNVSTIGLPKMMKSHKGYIYLTCLPFDIDCNSFPDFSFCHIYQAHRLLTSGLKAHKVVHASLGSRFGQQDLYLPILIEILMIYFFQYGSFGGSVQITLVNKYNASFIVTKFTTGEEQ